jgi:hypothetical protein
MSDHEPTHLIFYEGHFHEARRGNHSTLYEQGWWIECIDGDVTPICVIGQEEGCLPLDEARRIFEEEGKRPTPTPPAPTREEVIEAMARAIEPLAWSVKCFDFPDLDMPPRQREAKTRAAAAYDALLALYKSRR